MDGERGVQPATKGPVASQAADLSARHVDASHRPSVQLPVHGGGALPSAPRVPLVIPTTPPGMRLRFPGAVWRSRS